MVDEKEGKERKSLKFVQALNEAICDKSCLIVVKRQTGHGIKTLNRLFSM